LLTVATTARPDNHAGPVSYLADTIAALNLRGGAMAATYRQILCDGPSAPWWRGWPLLTTHERQGTRFTMWRAWQRAQELAVDLLLDLEDDVRPCRNAIPYAIAAGVPDDLAFVTHFPTLGQVSDEWPGSPEPRRRRDSESWGFPKVRRLQPSHYFSGNQFLAIPRRTIDWLVQHHPAESTPAWGSPNGADAWLGSLVKARGELYGAHLPALVDHVGEHSSAHPGLTLDQPNRRAACWPGSDFDALTLLKTPPEGPSSPQEPRL
jgi:hypothetical protein